VRTVKSKWSVAKAKEHFSEVLREARKEPQRVYNRDRLVALVVAPEEFEAFEEWQRVKRAGSLADAFRELREICREEAYELAVPERVDRPNPFLEIVNGAPEGAR
jgi:antitoxin (DNA-binding transcriptional repressor) of toxin-antitoxin stability system